MYELLIGTVKAPLLAESPWSPAKEEEERVEEKAGSCIGRGGGHARPRAES